MKIWKLKFELDEYESLVPANDFSVEEIQSFDGRKHLENWKPLKVKRMEPKNKKLKLSDAPGYRLIIFSKRAVDCIYPLISNYVEVLPLCYEEEYYIINVTTVLKAIDYEKSEYVTFSDGIRVLAFEKYAFLIDVVKDIPIFKISDESTRSAFVSDEFKKIVESNNLTGFRLELVWDSEES